MRSSDELRTAVESERMYKDSDFFHDVMGEMANRLGFFLAENWFDLHVPELEFPGIISTQGLRSVENVARAYQVADFAFRQRYENSRAYIIMTAHHKNLCDLHDQRMHARTIMSDSKFGLEKQVMDYTTLAASKKKNIFPEDPLAAAFRVDCIVENNGVYFFSPRMIYDAIVKQDS